jgi:biotin carboxyl carrier protein
MRFHPDNSTTRNKIPLSEQTTSGDLSPQQKAVHEGHRRQTVPSGIGMPDIRIVTEVAGRICALPIEAGGNVGDGDDIAFVEAVKKP